MSAQPATSHQQHGYENDRGEQYARYRRRDHANLESMVNLIISAIAEETGFEMPPKCRHLLSAIQGAHGGGEVVAQEFQRDYLTLGAQLQFTGSEDARRSRVRDWIDALESWQIKNYLLISIIKGGKVLGYRDDDSPILSRTTFIDCVLPVADEAVMRARASVQWRGDKAAQIKPHPGLALAAQVEWAVKQLGRHPEYKAPDEVTDEESGKESKPFSLSEYVARRQDIMLAENQRILGKLKDDEPMSVDEIDARLATLETFYARSRKDIDLGYESARSALMSLRDSRSKHMTDSTAPEEIAREVDERIEAGVRSGNAPPPTELEQVAAHFTQQGESHATGNAYTCNFSAPEGVEEIVIGEEGGGVFFPTPPLAETRVNIDDSAPVMVEWAQEWARQGFLIVPNHTVSDGVCSCVRGAECRTRGKHPRIKGWEKAATTDAAQVARWWQKWPRANIGAAMGGAQRLVVVDVDPKSGGNASLHDLAAAHGDEWLNTLHVETGSRGSHFYFTYPETVELRNSASKIAPGIDIRGEGGQVILPPSRHASGRRYALTTAAEIKPAPAWLIDELTRPPDQKPSVVVDFQERNGRAVGGGIIPEKTRNDSIFRIGCAIWGKGQAEDLTDLHAQLLQVNGERCSPPLDDAEVSQIVGSINRYPRGLPVPKGATL